VYVVTRVLVCKLFFDDTTGALVTTLVAEELFVGIGASFIELLLEIAVVPVACDDESTGLTTGATEDEVCTGLTTVVTEDEDVTGLTTVGVADDDCTGLTTGGVSPPLPPFDGVVLNPEFTHDAWSPVHFW
jgi:hypothetical protein